MGLVGVNFKWHNSIAALAVAALAVGLSMMFHSRLGEVVSLTALFFAAIWTLMAGKRDDAKLDPYRQLLDKAISGRQMIATCHLGASGKWALVWRQDAKGSPVEGFLNDVEDSELVRRLIAIGLGPDSETSGLGSQVVDFYSLSARTFVDMVRSAHGGPQAVDFVVDTSDILVYVRRRLDFRLLDSMNELDIEN